MKNKQKNKDLKVLIWLVLAVALIGIYSEHAILKPAEANAPYMQVMTLPESPDKTDLTVQDRILIEAHKVNFEWPDYLLRLSYCESRQREFATNMNRGHSLDRGVFQINKYYHPEVLDECAFSVECSARWTMEQIRAGRQSMWVCDKLI